MPHSLRRGLKSEFQNTSNTFGCIFFLPEQ